MDKLQMQTPDLTQSNIEKLAALFPSCITEARDEQGHLKKAVNFDLLRQMLSDEVLAGDEAYEFTWVGKKAAIVEANRPIRKTLRPCPAESVNWDTTENLYIEGDNLEVLKLLQESYLGKVKMIYIDPPYNTGNDFIYRDDFARSQEEYSEESGQVDENGDRLFRNTDSNGRFHSDWCSMIYSRLMLARNLLANDGVIAISISYNELHNLMKICQELFAMHQVFAVTVQTSGGKPNGALNISNEYVIFIIPENFEPTPTEEDMKEYATAYHGMNLATFNQVQRPNQAYPIYVNEHGIIIGCGKTLQERVTEGIYNGPLGDFVFDYDEAPAGAKAVWPVTAKGDQCVWRLIPERLLGDWKKGYIKVVPQNQLSGRNAYAIQYLSGGIIAKIQSGELDTYKASDNPLIPTLEIKNYKTAGSGIASIWTDNSFYTTKGSNEIRELFSGKVFSYPKPLLLIRYILKRATKDAELVLDFFSGSATTAHAVMQLNAEDGGHRKFIMVQLPEACDEKSEAYKAGYPNICEIGKERIRRAGTRLKSSLGKDGLAFRDMIKYYDKNGTIEGWNYAEWEESPDVINAKEKIADDLDIGFRVFRLDDSNMTDVYYSAGEYTQDLLSQMESNIKPDRTDLDLLFGCLLEWGLPLSMPYTSEKIEGCTVHTYNDGDLIACFDENIPDAVIKEIARRQPRRAVFRDSSFADSPAKINVGEIFKMLAPDTRVKVL